MMSALLYLATLLETAAQIVISTAVITWDMPRRPWGPHAALSTVATALAVCLVGAAGQAVPWLGAGNAAGSLVTFSLTLICVALLAHELLDMGVASALFCASAGFLVQNIASSLGTSLLLCLGLWGQGAVTHLTIWTSLLLACAVVRHLFRRYVRGESVPVVGSRGVTAMCLLAIVVSILDDSLFWSVSSVFGLTPAYQLALRTVHVVLAGSVLFMEFEMVFRKSALEELRRLTHQLDAQRRQYEISRQTIESINIKAHDIRHQIRHLFAGSPERASVDPEFLREVTREVNVYDAVADTGNDALDVVLTEKGLICERDSISLSLIADGSALGFMSAADIYSFFGNALDNAIEAVQAKQDGVRAISIDVRSRLGAVCIHVENSCTGEVHFVDGLPQTTKPDRKNHGFGVKSMRLVIEKYGGVLTMNARGGTFELDALIPHPSAA